MKTFDDLTFEKIEVPYNTGVHAQCVFDNGYGVSAVLSDMSYGNKEGLYELAVLDSDGQITYETPITTDVLGWLTEDDVTRHMRSIQEL